MEKAAFVVVMFCGSFFLWIFWIFAVCAGGCWCVGVQRAAVTLHCNVMLHWPILIYMTD